MKITVRGESVKMDPEARTLIIKALNEVATMWLVSASTQSPNTAQATLADVGNVKAFATLLEPKDDAAE